MLAAVLLAVAAGTVPVGSDDASQVARLIDLLALEPGMSVADVGAGSGEMTTLLARRLGAASRVYSTDINDERLAEIRTAVARDGLENVIVVKGAERATNLPDACCDAVFIRDVYHHFVDPAAMNRSLLAALKPGGRLAVIDFAPGPDSKVPSGVPENRGGHGIRPEQIVEEVGAAGFRLERAPDDWEGKLFLVLFRKPRADSK
jgi:predicted methyltransferase